MKVAIYPGSFDPITNGHLDVLAKALDVFDKVIVLVADNPNKKSRFSVSQRVQMIKEATKGMKNVNVDSTSGLTVDFAKKAKTNILIRGLRNVTDYKYESLLASEYHKCDPNIKLCFFMANPNNASISSSKIERMFTRKKDISKFVPNSVVKMYKKR